MQIWLWQDLNNEFEKKADNAWINLDYLKMQNAISRYDITRLLNAVECIDCINPSNRLMEKYTNNFRVNFTILPWKDFNDILYKKAIYNNQSYYYCVSSVADKEYMFWYPTLTSPLCPWNFCWENNITKWEFVQVITNILSKYIRKNYTADWRKIKIRYDKQIIWSYSYNIFNTKDKSIITNKAEQCEDKNCPLWGSSEFRTYLKYCMFNLEECQMKEFWRIIQGYWPIAEINIAIKEWIITNNSFFTDTIHKPIDWKTAVEAFWKIFPKIQCDFDSDYDCDGILNKNDNCPNSYNPTQTDTDKDKIWDVCDNDIDGDGIKNPIGIIDERGSINISIRTSQTDNCLFIQNSNQKDNNNNYQWDTCDLSSTKGISIGANIIWRNENSKIYAYVITDYNPIENDRVRNINGKEFFGKNISYPITKSGVHTLYVQSKSDPKRKASISLMAQYNKWYATANLSISLSKKYIPTILTAEILTNGENNNVLWNLEWPEKQNKTIQNNLRNSFLLRKEGNYILTATLKNTNNETIWVTSKSFVIENENNKIQNINISNISPLLGEKITMNINSTIRERRTDRWDWTISTESKNNISHTYTKNGVYIIKSNIILEDNTKINDYKTVITKNDNKSTNKILEIKPNLLEWITKTVINLDTKRNGYANKDIISRYSYDGISASTGIKLYIWSYINAGVYYPETKEIFWVCQYTASQSTVIINNSSSSCLSMKIQNTKAQCDMDWDWIDDRCDNDIDGDWIKNPIWLIIENHISCDINKAIIDKEKRDSMMKQLQSKDFNNICKPLDNCPLQSNNDQIKDTNNWLWNVCKDNQYNFWNSTNTWNINNGNDKDNDGINDDKDNCPDISETYNWYQDNDWCPELWNDNICETTVISNPNIGFECLQCPCQYVQESADINPWDTIRATLWNISGSILQSRSDTKTL